MNKKVIAFIIIIIGICLLYFLIFNYNKTNKKIIDSFTDDIILSNIDLNAIDCSLDNLDKIIFIENESFVCSLLNNKFTWIKIDSISVSNNNVIPINNIEDKKELVEKMSKKYVFENQLCSERNLNQKAYLIDTNIEMICLAENNSFIWKRLFLDLNQNNYYDENYFEEDINLNENFDSISDVLGTNFENSILNQECFFYDEFKKIYDANLNVELICLYSIEDNNYKWVLNQN